MAVWSTVTASNIQESFGRFDAEFYRPENLEAFNQVTTKNFEPIARLATDGYRVVYENTKILPSERVTGNCPIFLQATNISANGLAIDFQGAGYVSESDWHRYPKGRIQPGELLIEVKGQAEKVAIVPQNINARVLVSGSLFKLSVDKSKINPWYVFVYFSTKHGKLLRDRLKTNTLIGFVSKPQLYSIPVFIPDNEVDINKVATLSEKAFSLLKESEAAYTQAQQLLESELGLDKLRFDKPVGYTARFSVVGLSDSVSANRIDAQCFSPEAVFYEDWLLKHANCDRLSLLLASTAKGRQQAEAETGTTNYCSIKHITGHEIVGASKAYPAAGTPTARKHDLLLAITGATIGKIGIVNRYDNLVFSGDMLRLRANGSINPHYLLLALDHHLGQVQFNRWITGSTNGHLAPRDVGRVLVPRLAPKKEEQIAALVAESLEKRQESEQLLDQAKSRVEQLIEEAVRR